MFAQFAVSSKKELSCSFSFPYCGRCWIFFKTWFSQPFWGCWHRYGVNFIYYQVLNLGLKIAGVNTGTYITNSGLELWCWTGVKTKDFLNDWSSSSCWGCLKKWNSVSNSGLEMVSNPGVEMVSIWSSWVAVLNWYQFGLLWRSLNWLSYWGC